MGVPSSSPDVNPLSFRAWLAALAGALVFAGAVLLAGGAGSALAAPSCVPSGADTVCTFSTPGADTFTVPAGVTEASFDVFGAQGGSVDGFFAGRGGRARAELALTPGATLTVVVGGAGGSSPGCSFQKPGGVGGVNGGAPGGSGACEGPGGGGASDVRIGGTGLSDRVLVAGGGGGGANLFTDPGPHGGGGGGLSGEAGGPSGTGGSGGDQTGASGSGQPGNGSPGADGSPDCCFPPVGGGGGGGGYYGGAGGAPNSGGGGGSGFGPPGVLFETGVRAGDGLITITYRVPYAFAGFFEPIDVDAVNVAKAGQTVPVKWRLTDAQGVPVDDPASFVSLTSTTSSCSPAQPADDIETYAGGSGLQYLGNGNWQFNWKTPKAYANQCRTMKLNLADGTTHTAEFRFK